MTVPLKYSNSYIPVKWFLTSYRALLDGKTGIRHLEKHLKSSTFLLSDWKVIWIGSCTLLRASIGFFQVDGKSCINEEIRRGIREEWISIKENKKHHPIYWKFLKEERDNIIHYYEWAAYEKWMDKDGVIQPDPIPLLSIGSEDANSVLIMRSGPYKNCNSLDLLKESAKWVEARIYDAIRRAGFDPDENRNVGTFEMERLVEGTPHGEIAKKLLLGR